MNRTWKWRGPYRGSLTGNRKEGTKENDAVVKKDCITFFSHVQTDARLQCINTNEKQQPEGTIWRQGGDQGEEQGSIMRDAHGQNTMV